MSELSEENKMSLSIYVYNVGSHFLFVPKIK